MAIDMSKMKAKLNSVQSRGQARTSQFWRPSDGDQTIRIVPTADGDPFKEFWFHYNAVSYTHLTLPTKRIV